MTAAEPGVRTRAGVVDVVVAIVIGFLFAAGLWGAVGNVLGLPGYLQTLGIAVPWVPLVATVVVPVVLYVAALLLARGRASFARTVILVVALAADSALAVTLSFLTLAAIPVR